MKYECQCPCLIKSYLVLCFVLWDDDVVLSAYSGDLLYYSYPLVCGQISRHKAAAKMKPSITQTLILDTKCTSRTASSDIWDVLLLYQWPNVFTFYKLFFFVGSLIVSRVDNKMRQSGDQEMMGSMLSGDHLYYMPGMRSDHTRREYIITCETLFSSNGTNIEAFKIKLGFNNITNKSTF